ncbi:hypothetical protein R6Q57_006733 [Mikania cordata]
MDLSNLNCEELTLLGSGACTMLGVHFSSQLASQHLYYWKNPKEQSAILMIILMVPVYAVYSFVVAKFLGLLFGYMNMDISNNIVPDEVKGREIRHVFPVSLFQHGAKQGPFEVRQGPSWARQEPQLGQSGAQQSKQQTQQSKIKPAKAGASRNHFMQSNSQPTHNTTPYNTQAASIAAK